MRALKEAQIEPLLPLRDGHADGSLRAAKPLGCGSEAPGFRYGKKRSQGIAIEVSHDLSHQFDSVSIRLMQPL